MKEKDIINMANGMRYGIPISAKQIPAKSKKTITTISWDWKDSPDKKDLQKALKPLGIFVYDNPNFESADAFGFILSKEKLTQKEIEEYAKEECE